MRMIEVQAGFSSMKSAGLLEKRVRTQESYSVVLHTLLKDD